jgi:hypothetical protein
MIIEIIVGSIVVALFTTLSYLYIRSRIIRKNLLNGIVVAAMDREKLLEKIQDVVQELENAKLSDNNEFVKFLSDSREWAFNYIEEFQAIVEQIKATYVSGNETERATLISKLILMLPEDPESKLKNK